MEVSKLMDRVVFRWIHTRLTQVRFFDGSHKRIRMQRLPGTGGWFLMSPIFNRWLIDDHQTLFCPGAPGSGKTMIASMVVDKLINSFQADSTIGIAYFYCSWQQED
jgi:Cdc6-like AAA superfamily ATPase